MRPEARLHGVTRDYPALLEALAAPFGTYVGVAVCRAIPVAASLRDLAVDLLLAVGKTEAPTRRRAGAGPVGNDVVLHRLRALLATSPGGDEPPEHTAAQDARRCGALIVRLAGAANPTVVATWMGWTLERTTAAVAELERRLDACGLQLVSDAGGDLAVRERARLRRRPARLPYELAQRLDAEEHLHALAHLARGDHCAHADEREQVLLDLGAAVPAGYPGLHPSDVVAAAFVGVHRRATVLPPVIVIDHTGERWPPQELWDSLRASAG